MNCSSPGITFTYRRRRSREKNTCPRRRKTSGSDSWWCAVSHGAVSRVFCHSTKGAIKGPTKIKDEGNMTGIHVNTPHAGKTSTKNGKDNTTASWHDMLWVFHHGFDSQHDSACVASQSDPSTNSQKMENGSIVDALTSPRRADSHRSMEGSRNMSCAWLAATGRCGRQA